MAEHTILAIDRNETNLEHLQQFLDDASFNVVTRRDLEGLPDLIQSGRTLHLVLIDLTRFEPDSWQHLATLRDHDIPFVIFSSSPGRNGAPQDPVRDAEEVMGKPLNPDKLLRMVESIVED